MKCLATWSLICGQTPFDLMGRSRAGAASTGGAHRASRRKMLAPVLLLFAVLALLAAAEAQAGGVRGGVVNDAPYSGR